MSRKRENSLDLLRIIAAILVCAVHVCNVGRAQAAEYTELNFEFHYFYVMFHFGQAAVACFIALSGAFIIKADTTKNYPVFYKRTWKKVVIPTIFFSVFYILFEACTNSFGKPGVTNPAGEFPKALFGKLVMGVMGFPAVHMWYMFMLMVLYLLAPFVVLAREYMGEKHCAKAAVVLWVLGAVDAVSHQTRVSWSLGYTADLLGIFMLGYVMHEWASKRRGKTVQGILLIAGGCGLILAEYVIWLFTRGNALISMILQQRPHNPFLSMGALLCIAGFTMLEMKCNMGTLSLLTLWVYIVHPAVMEIVFRIEGAVLHVPSEEIGLKNPVLTGTVNIVIVAVLSFIVSYFVDKLMNAPRKKRGNMQKGNA
jgi:peptidoglycan/LPS O-acetylase OafA/YrhL